MKYPFIIFALFLCVTVVKAQQKDTAKVEARFPGGPDKFYEYLKRNFRYPEVAAKNNIEGKVVLQFTVDTNGDITDIKVLQGLTPETNAEAVRLIIGSANWLPAKEKGVFVKSILTIAINFNLIKKPDN